MKKRWIALLLCAALCASSFGGCALPGDETQEESKSSSENSSVEKEEADPFGKFSDTVTMTMGKPDIPDNKLPNGDTIEDNEYIRYIKEKLNVEIKYDWLAQGDAYNQKLALTLSGGNLPDVLFVPSQEILDKLVDAGQIEDLTQVYEDNISPRLEELYASLPDGEAFKSATYDGKLMALPDLTVQANNYSMLWVRSDWMEKLNLSEPKTLEDVLNIARAFVEQDPDGNGQDDTVGFTGSDVLHQINSLDVFSPIFYYTNSFPQTWLRNSENEIVYGSVQPETKEALEILRDMYAEGLIDPEFATKDPWNDNQALRASGKAGIFFAPWWIPWNLTDSVVNDPEADWKAYMAPLNKDGKCVTTAGPTNTSYIVVRKGYEHADAVVRVLNVQQQCLDRMDPYFEENIQPIYLNPDLGYTVSWNNWPFPLSIAYADAVERRAVQIDEVLNGKGSADDMDETTKGWYDRTVAEMEDPKKDLDAWAHSVVTRSAALTLANTDIEVVRSEYYGTTETMEQKMATLNKMESETFLKIIMGKEPLDSFDSFVEQWYSLGGEQITEEVRAAVD